MNRHGTLGKAIVFLLLLALLPTAALAVNRGEGDSGGVIAARIEEALRLGIDPAKHAGIVLQQGAAEGARATQAARPAPPPVPLTDDEKALNFAAGYVAQNGGAVYDFTNGVPGPLNVEVPPGGVIVCGGTVYLNTGMGYARFGAQSAADAKDHCDGMAAFNEFTIIYPRLYPYL